MEKKSQNITMNMFGVFGLRNDVTFHLTKNIAANKIRANVMTGAPIAILTPGHECEK